MSYTFEIKMTEEHLKAYIEDLKEGVWDVTFKEYTVITFDYKDNGFTITVFDPDKEAPEYEAIFSVNSIADAFWMILSLTATGYFDFKYNEPLEILRKAL